MFALARGQPTVVPDWSQERRRDAANWMVGARKAVEQRHAAVCVDFIFDPLVAANDGACLMWPQGTDDQQAQLAAQVAGNRECALQALMVCSLH